MAQRAGLRRGLPVGLVLAGVAAIAWGAYLVLAQFTRGPVPPGEYVHKDTVATVLSPPLQVPAFQLHDDGGRPFTADGLRGRWSLLFFGYSHCPDICPMTLKTLTRARARLADLPPAQQPRIVFVSVDPERDTAARLADYVRYFGSDIVGVTGPHARLEALTRPLGIAYHRESLTPDATDYAVAHSSSILYVDAQGRVRALASPPHEPEAIADDYRKLVALPEPGP
jgi:protein SCO1